MLRSFPAEGHWAALSCRQTRGWREAQASACGTQECVRHVGWWRMGKLCGIAAGLPALPG